MQRIKNLIVNCGLVFASIIACLLILEFVVFRFLLLPSDVPANDAGDGIVRYVANQIGTWRERNEIAAPYAINAQGWNSGAGDYSETRKSGRMRIAIVGDSFVEALQVAHTRSVGEQLSQELANAAS